MLALPAVAAAATPAKRAETYLLRAQNKDGGFGAAPKLGSSPLYTGWAGLGLGSAGRNPRDVKRSGGRSAAAYVVRGSASLRDIGEIERTVLFARVAGMDPRNFGGRNLLAEIEKRRRGDGSISGFVSYTAFGDHGAARVRRVRRIGDRPLARGLAERRRRLRRGARLVERLGHDRRGAPGARHRRARARRAAAQRPASWLRANQNDDGGFGQFKGRDSNAQSTSYAVQGLLAAGARRGATVSRARAYLVRLQRSDGSVAYSSSSAQTPVWVTAQALMALNGQAAADRGRAAEQAHAARRRRPAARVAERPLRAAAARPARSRARAAARQRRAAPARQQQATPPREPWAARLRRRSPERRTRRAPSALARRPPPRAARRIRSRCRCGPRCWLRSGLLALLWVIHRYVLPGRWPGMG